MLSELPVIVIGIVVSVVVLTIEYRTGWFAGHTGATGLRPLLEGWRARIDQQKKHWPGILRIIQIEFPVLVLVLGMLLIILDPVANSTFFLLNALAVLLLAGIAHALYPKPMDQVSAWLIFLGGAAGILIKLRASNSDALTPETVNLALAALFTAVGLIWISAAMVSEHAKDLHRDIDFLRLAPDIDKFVHTEEQKLLERLRAEWPTISANLALRRSQAVGTFGWFVPVKFDGFTITLGCLEKWQQKQVDAYQHKAPSFRATIVTLVQEAMPDVPVQVEFKKIDAAIFQEAQSLIAPEKKGAEEPAPPS